jgi:selenocysteine-specific elongation factor
MRYRRKAGRADAAVLARLEALSKGTPAERLTNALRELKFASREEAMTKAQLNSEEFDQAASALSESKTLLAAQGVLGLADGWRDVLTNASDLLASFHAAQPLQEGMPRDTLRSRLKLDVRVFNALLAISNLQSPISSPPLQDDGETVRLAAHRVLLNPAQQKAADALLAQCAAQPWNTPLVKDCKAAVGDSVYDVLLRQRKLVQCGAEVVLLAETYDDAVRRVRELILRDGQITAAQVRDAFATTRKYALGLLEHLDSIGETKRVGDARVLR